mgnify:CR=1 FL=1
MFSGVLYGFLYAAVCSGGSLESKCRQLADYDGLMYRISNTTASVLGLEDTLKEVVIPAKVDGRSVISIENCAFDGETSIRKVVIPSSVVALGNHAFRNCTNLSEVEGGGVAGQHWL